MAISNKGFKTVQEAFAKFASNAQAVAAFRTDASRKAAIANKRIERLKASGLTDSPAYQKYVVEGGGKFGVKGKTFNEVQREMSRLNNFIDSKTSTIRGINSTLKEMAANTGIKYRNLTELRSKSAKFFELASKVEQYLRTVEDMASAIGYQKIWEAINQYTQQAKVDLAGSEVDIESMIESVTGALKAYDSPIPKPNGGWFTLKDSGNQ